MSTNSFVLASGEDYEFECDRDSVISILHDGSGTAITAELQVKGVNGNYRPLPLPNVAAVAAETLKPLQGAVGMMYQLSVTTVTGGVWNLNVYPRVVS